MKKGLLKEALKDLDAAIATKAPRVAAEAQLGRGRVLEELGRKAEAKAAFDEAFRLGEKK